MIWTRESLLGWSVEVTDRIELEEADGRVDILDPARVAARCWSLRIERGEPGFPVYWREGDGRERCFGGPSHPQMSMARCRATHCLDGLIKAACGQLQDTILERRRADAAAE